jgi:fructoselysine-6-P-deglycase FrlB-like protein
VASIDKPQKKKPAKVSSLDAMEKEIENQIEDLPKYAHQLDHNYQRSVPSHLIFTGAGDSFAAALFTHYLSNGKARAYDPYDLQLYPNLTRDKLLFLTSVSGRTRANILLARRTKRLAKRRIAVTADQQSPLAKECDDTIQLSYRASEVLTSGTASFTTSLLALASTITSLPKLASLEELNVRASNWAKHVKSLRHSGFMFAGSGIGYALSAYGAFKIHEVLGQPADYQQTEQVGHSKLFSLRRTDNIVCTGTRNDQKTRQLSNSLSASGFRSHLLNLNAENPIIGALQAAFTFQHLAVSLAITRGLRECHFLSDENRLQLSNRLIY